MRKKIAAAFVVAASLAFTLDAAQASVIDFNSHPDDFGTPIIDSGFTFSFVASGWGVFGPASGACCSINYNGTTALYADGDRDGNANSVMSLVGGGAFNVFGFDAASYWNGASGTLNVIGTLSGGGTVSTSFSVNSAFQTFALSGFTNLVSLRFEDSQSGAFLQAPGFGIDNINLAPVPEPSSIALIGMALLAFFGVGAMRRRSDA